MIAWKQMARQHADQALDGRLRLNLLTAYWNMENVAPGIRDAAEGVVTGRVEGPVAGGSGAANRLAAVGFLVEPGAAANFIGCRTVYKLPPTYALCLTNDREAAPFDLTYDTLVQIKDVHALGNALGLALTFDQDGNPIRSPLKPQYAVGNVRYEARRWNAAETERLWPDPFVKEDRPEYRAQKELRVIWPAAEKRGAVFVDVPRDLLEIVEWKAATQNRRPTG